jgi:hypothetical protein
MTNGYTCTWATGGTINCNTALSTVNSGTANQIAMYSGTGTAVSGDTNLTDSGTILNYAGSGGISTTQSASGSDAYQFRAQSSYGTNVVTVSVVNGSITPYTFNFPDTAPSGVLKFSSNTLGSATYSDVVSLWTTCGSNFMLGNGTCSSGTGNFSGGVLTSALTLKAGATGAGTGPLYFQTGGSLLTSPVGGAMEVSSDLNTLYYDIATGSARKTIAFTDSAITSSHYIGTTSIALNRASAALSLAGVSLDDSAAQFYNVAAPTKLVKIDPSNQTAGHTGIIQAPDGGTATLVSGTELVSGGAASLTTLSASGQITSTVATNTAPFVVSSTTQVANLNVASAGLATNVSTVTKSDNTNYYLGFLSANSSSSQAVNVGPATYNPSTGSITATTFVGAVTGTASGNLTSSSTLDTTKLSTAAIPNGVTGTTQSINSNDTKLATDAYADRGSIVTVGTSRVVAAKHEYVYCTGTCSVTPLTPVANEAYELCVQNDANVSTAITLAGITNVYYENIAHTGYGASGGTMTATAAAGNQICISSRDATHYHVWGSNGAWTAN